MNQQANPYAAPQEAPAPQGPLESVQVSQNRRFLGWIVDLIILFIVNFGVGIGIVVVGGEIGLTLIEGPARFFIGYPFVLAYYLVFEITTSRTLGKMATGTIVVNAQGEKPSAGQIVGRTLLRFIPFEAFTFLGTKVRGLHDIASKTYVVRAK